MPNIVRTSCPTGQYTQISSGNNNVSFKITSNLGGRIAFNATQPAANFANYDERFGGDSVELGGLGTTTTVWYMPNGVAQDIAAYVS